MCSCVRGFNVRFRLAFFELFRAVTVQRMSLQTFLEQAAIDLIRLDRYDRRAWSRLKHAIRAFMNLKLMRDTKKRWSCAIPCPIYRWRLSKPLVRRARPAQTPPHIPDRLRPPRQNRWNNRPKTPHSNRHQLPRASPSQNRERNSAKAMARSSICLAEIIRVIDFCTFGRFTSRAS